MASSKTVGKALAVEKKMIRKITAYLFIMQIYEQVLRDQKISLIKLVK
jgi:hypothetical protein